LLIAYIYLKGLLNGFRAIGRLALVEILGPVTTLLLVYPICIYVGEGNALGFIWLLSAAQSMMVIASFVILYRAGWLSAFFVKTHINNKQAHIRYFLTISGTTFLAGILATGTLLFVRTIIVKHGGLHQAGLFDLAWSLSGSYVMLLLGSFGTYYSPTLSQAKNREEQRILIRRVIRLSTLLMTPMIVSVVVLKPLLIKTLYSNEYMAALEMVRWMLVGDYLKITSWVLAITVIVNADMKIYFWTEAFWNIGFLALSVLAIEYSGDLQGMGMAFIALYFCLVVYYSFYVRRVYALKFTPDLLILWLIGFAVVIMASVQTWNSTTVNWLYASLWITGSVGLGIAFLKKSEQKMIMNKLRIKLRIK
jgi:O-antigen/teichoic acid export membrane protein